MFHINGSNETANQFSVDGINANLSLIADPSATIRFGDGLPMTAAGGFNSLISQGNVNEFGVSAWSYKANLALSSGRQVSIASKAGTNSFHGTLFENFGNSALNANDWFANSRALKKPVSQTNHYGGSFGGRIISDKLFFFSTYEGLALRHGSFALTDVPSLIARQNAPLGIQPLLNAFPLPNGAARNDGFAEFASTFTTPATSNIASLRLDYRHNNNLEFRGRYHFANSYATTRGNEGFSLNTLKRTDNQIQTVTGKTTYQASNSVYEVSANYSRVKIGQAYSLDNFGGANITSSDFANGFNLSTFDFYGRNTALAASSKIEGTLEQFNMVGGGAIFIDTHDITFGADFRRLFLTTGSQPTERSVLFNGINGALSGNFARTNFFNRTALQNLSVENLSAYIQDNWRVTPDFTLQYGLIWTTNRPVSNDGNQKQLTLINTNPPFAFAPNGTQIWKATYNNFAPRISATYCFGDSCDNVIRAGFGLYYDNSNINTAEIFGHSFPFANGTVAFNQPFTSPNQNQTSNKTFIGYDPNLKLPLVRQWSVSFERAISNSISLTTTYHASQGRRLLLTRTYVNQDPTFPFARLTTNEGESDYKAFQLRFQKASFRGFSFLLNYNFTKSLDNVSPDLLSRAIIATPQQDRSFSDFDTRHSLNGYVTYATPNEFQNKFVKGLLSEWSFTTYLNLRTALPINVVYGGANSFGISFLRPDAIQNTQQLSSSSFAIPTTDRQGTLTRNSLRSFPFYQVDLGASRKINITQETSLTFRLGVVNLFNHTNFAAPSFFDLSIGTIFPNGVFLPNSTFGQTSSLASTAGEREIGPRLFSAYQPNASRSLQLSVKFNF